MALDVGATWRNAKDNEKSIYLNVCILRRACHTRRQRGGWKFVNIIWNAALNGHDATRRRNLGIDYCWICEVIVPVEFREVCVVSDATTRLLNRIDQQRITYSLLRSALKWTFNSDTRTRSLRLQNCNKQLGLLLHGFCMLASLFYIVVPLKKWIYVL